MSEKAIRWHESVAVQSLEEAIVTKRKRLEEARAREENASTRLDRTRVGLDDLRALQSIKRKSVGEVQAAESAVKELDEARARAKGEAMVLEEELRADALALEMVRAEGAQDAARNIVLRVEELCLKLEPLAREVMAINAELDMLHTAAISQFENEGPAGELRRKAGVTYAAGLSEPLRLVQMTPGSLEAWLERWKPSIAKAKAKLPEAAKAGVV